jgi:hypothetical protein
MGVKMVDQKWGVYFFPERDKENPAIKIGYSVNPIKRLKQLQTGHPTKIGCEGWWLLGTENQAVITERILHEMFKKERIRKNGEWFNYTQNIRDYLSEHSSHPYFCRYYY